MKKKILISALFAFTTGVATQGQAGMIDSASTMDELSGWKNKNYHADIITDNDFNQDDEGMFALSGGKDEKKGFSQGDRVRGINWQPRFEGEQWHRGPSYAFDQAAWNWQHPALVPYSFSWIGYLITLMPADKEWKLEFTLTYLDNEQEMFKWTMIHTIGDDDGEEPVHTPLPATALLLGTGLAGVAGVRGRKAIARSMSC